MKYLNFTLLLAAVSMSSIVKAEKVNLNELLKSKVVLEMEADDLKIEDMSICTHDPRSVLTPENASLQADAVCKLLGEQMEPAQKLQNSTVEYIKVKDSMGKRNQCRVISPFGTIGVATSPFILSKVNCIPDNRPAFGKRIIIKQEQ